MGRTTIYTPTLNSVRSKLQSATRKALHYGMGISATAIGYLTTISASNAFSNLREFLFTAAITVVPTMMVYAYRSTLREWFFKSSYIGAFKSDFNGLSGLMLPDTDKNNALLELQGFGSKVESDLGRSAILEIKRIVPAIFADKALLPKSASVVTTPPAANAADKKEEPTVNATVVAEELKSHSPLGAMHFILGVGSSPRDLLNLAANNLREFKRIRGENAILCETPSPLSAQFTYPGIMAAVELLALINAIRDIEFIALEAHKGNDRKIKTIKERAGNLAQGISNLEKNYRVIDENKIMALAEELEDFTKWAPQAKPLKMEATDSGKTTELLDKKKKGGPPLIRGFAGAAGVVVGLAVKHRAEAGSAQSGSPAGAPAQDGAVVKKRKTK